MTPLTSQTSVNESDMQPLTDVPTLPFLISIEHSLANRYEFKDMKQKDIKKLHVFIEETVGKNLSISDVESMYLRKRGLGKKMIREVINGSKKEVLHFGKDRQPFRIHGYYNGNYLVIAKIDCDHDLHKS